MTSSTTIGREPITVVEIDQDFCSLTYGVAPCAAAVGVTGEQKCFNTIVSCQDTDNFTLSSKTLRFCTPSAENGLSKSNVIIPSVVSVTTVPTKINIGGSDPTQSPLGSRARVTISLRDHPYHDGIVDPYVSERNYDPSANGTFWSKWIARNPYYQGRSIRVLTGYVGQQLGEMLVRNYVIERVDGPSNGVVQIIAKDPIKLLDDNRTKAPVANFGTIDSDIDEVAGSLTLVSGAGAQYAASGVIRIGSELASFTRSGDVLTLTERGVRNSGATAHSEGDLVQEVLIISNQRVDSLLYDLMTIYGGIPASYIPVSDWSDEADLWCSGFNLSAWIAEPTGVGQLVGEIIDQTGVFIWWDEENQHIRFRATRPFFPEFDGAAISISGDQNIVADSLDMEFKPDERITQVWIYYDEENPAADHSDDANFARRRILVDADSESEFRYNDKTIRTIHARFLDSANDAATSVVATRILERARETPRLIKFSMDAKDESIKVGDVVEMSHPSIVDLYGQIDPTLMQIVSREPVDVGHRIAYEARPYLLGTRYCRVVPDSYDTDSPRIIYSIATDEQRENGGWIAPSAIGFDNGDKPYKVL